MAAADVTGALAGKGASFRGLGRGWDFWRVKMRDVTPEKAGAMLEKGRPLEVRVAGGEWGPVQNTEELQRLLSLYETAAAGEKPPLDVKALAERGLSTALAAAVAASGPAAAGSKPATEAVPLHDPYVPKRIGTLNFVNGIRRNFANPVNFFNEFHGKHGSTFKVNLPTGHKFLFDIRPESVFEALKETDKGDSIWEKPPTQGHGLAFLLGTDNVFLGKGEEWKKAHDVMKPFFHGPAIRSEETSAAIGHILDEHIDGIKARAASSPDRSVTVDLRQEMQLATLDVAMRFLLGAKLSDGELRGTQQAFQTVMKWLARETANPTDVSLSKLSGLLPGASELKDAYKVLTDLGDRVIAERRASGDPGDDLLGGLLKAKDPATVQPYSD
ncbi:MAG: cytochrome P450, partial [Armatimonadetes bacterium]|nr:cytochrome P450 [Armatimonadota bacterium]